MLKTTPHFWNLNEDSQLSRKVIHFIKAGNFQGYFWMPVMFSHRACLELCLPLLSGLLQFLREQAMAQWWEHSPPTNVALVHIPASTPYVGWVCCWFSPLLREVFLRVLQFPISSKTNIYKFQFDQESGRRRTTLCTTSKSLFVIYLLFM